MFDPVEYVTNYLKSRSVTLDSLSSHAIYSGYVRHSFIATVRRAPCTVHCTAPTTTKCPPPTHHPPPIHRPPPTHYVPTTPPSLPLCHPSLTSPQIFECFRWLPRVTSLRLRGAQRGRVVRRAALRLLKYLVVCYGTLVHWHTGTLVVAALPDPDPNPDPDRAPCNPTARTR